MDETATPLGRGAFHLPRRGARPDYKQKLAHPPAFSHPPDDDTTTDASMLWVEQLEQLAGQAEVERAAFQSVAVAVLQMLDRVRYRQRRVAEAALSLAQRQKLQHMLDGIDATAGAIGQLLNPTSIGMLGKGVLTEAASEPSWWFALCEALHVLEEGAAWIESIAAGQPQGSATRALSRILARLLHQHFQALLAEAEHWMS